MSQQSLGDSALHPVLQAALRSLDLELEAELAQYRHHRAVSIFPLAHQVSPAQPAKTSKFTSSVELAIAPRPAERKDLVFNSFGNPRQATDLAPAAARDASLLALTRSRLNPDSYLASSKALLKNLDEVKTPRKLSLVTVLLTAWGVTLALLMLAGVAVGYLVIHLSGPSRPRLANTPAPGTPERLVSNLESPQAGSPTPATAKPAISPDLAAKEFAPLNPSNLSQLQPASGQSSQANSKPISTNIPQASAEVREATGDRAPAPTAPPSPGQALPPQAPPPQNSQNQQPPVTAKTADVSASSQDRYYYVLTNFTDNQSLQEAQKVVKDAHVRTFADGKRVQVGAFNDSQSAQRLVQALKQKGVSATILKP